MILQNKIGVSRTINASFALTDLGGSILPKEVLDAYIEADKYYVDVKNLSEKAGEIIAKITGAEAARITTGAFSALVLSVAACISGIEPNKMAKLPDTTRMKNEVIIQKNLRNPFDRSIEVGGGKIVIVEPTIEAMEEAISDKTAAIHYYSVLDANFTSGWSQAPITGAIPLEKVIDLGHKHDIPIIVDAAGQTYPTDRLTIHTKMGADLICYSGKYFQAPNSTGFVCGKKDFIEAVAANDFTGPSYGYFGRGYKLDKQEIVAVVVALQRWMKLDHEEMRLKPAEKRRERMMEALKGIPDLKLTPMPYIYHIIGLQLTFGKKTPEDTAQLRQQLLEGDPPIRVRNVTNNNMLINTLFLLDGDEHIIVQRLKAIM